MFIRATLVLVLSILASASASASLVRLTVEGSVSCPAGTPQDLGLCGNLPGLSNATGFPIVEDGPGRHFVEGSFTMTGLIDTSAPPSAILNGLHVVVGSLTFTAWGELRPNTADNSCPAACMLALFWATDGDIWGTTPMIGQAGTYNSWQQLALGGGGLTSGFAEYNKFLRGFDAAHGWWSALWEARDMSLQPVAAVAEPASLFLAGLSLMGLVALRCRRAHSG